jgi:hypothetical protein
VVAVALPPEDEALLVRATVSRASRRRALQWKVSERGRLRWYRAGRKVFAAQFARERQGVIRALNDGGTPQQGLARAVLALADQTPAWEKALRRLYRGVAAEFAPQAVTLLEQKALDRSIFDWIAAESASKVVTIQDSTKAMIQDVLSQGIEAGDTITDMTHRLTDLYRGFATARAYRIAATETVNAMGASQTLQVSAEGDPDVEKEWLSSRDPAVRDSHQRLDGQRVKVDEPFEIDGQLLRWPADGGLGAAPAYTVNCRCSLNWLPGPAREETPYEALAAELADTPYTAYDPALVFGEDLGSPGGTMGARLWKGTDGKTRVVKTYDDPAQTYGEAVTSTLYRALGINAPESGFTVRNHRFSLVTEFVENKGTLGKVGLTKGRARKVLDGYAADVLTANWDVVGLDLDNIVVTGTQVTRVDNGGTLLMRAQGGRKPWFALETPTEWETFQQSFYNPAYHQVLKKAGFNTADALGKDGLKQIQAITSLAEHTNGFQTLLPKIRGLIGDEDHASIVSMLRVRAEFLQSTIVPRLESYVAQAAQQALAPFVPSTDVLPDISRLEFNTLRNRWTRSWGGSSISPDALLMAHAVRAEFGTGQALIRAGYGDVVKVFTDVEILQARRVVREMWQETQADFEQRDLKMPTTLYRGIRNRQEKDNVIESWSDRKAISKNFDGYDILQRKEIDRSRVLIMYDSPGWGSGRGEREYILINRILGDLT